MEELLKWGMQIMAPYLILDLIGWDSLEMVKQNYIYLGL